MAIASTDEKRIIRHLSNIGNECAAISKLLDEDESEDFVNTKVFISKARKAFKSLTKVAVGEREVELV